MMKKMLNRSIIVFSIAITSCGINDSGSSEGFNDPPDFRDVHYLKEGSLLLSTSGDEIVTKAVFEAFVLDGVWARTFVEFRETPKSYPLRANIDGFDGNIPKGSHINENISRVLVGKKLENLSQIALRLYKFSDKPTYDVLALSSVRITVTTASGSIYRFNCSDTPDLSVRDRPYVRVFPF